MPSSGVQTCADRKSTRLNSSHTIISYAVFCLKKKSQPTPHHTRYPPSRTPARPATTPAARRERGHALVHRTRHAVPGAFREVITFFFLRIRRPPKSPLFPFRALFG